MCKLIANLAGADEFVVKEMIRRLEGASGSPGIDIRLTSEIYGKLNMKMRELGLDPNDTTPTELYNSLQNMTMLHDKFLANRLGIDEHQNPDKVLPAVVHVINRLHVPKQVWALKPTAIKRLLKSNPPKALMKQLNYRSLDSMLKRESCAVLLTAASYIESSNWQLKILDQYKKIKSSDMEQTQAQIVYMDDTKWQHLSQFVADARRSSILHSVEAGAVVVLPMSPGVLKGLTITSMMMILHWLNEIRSYSTFFKFHHMQPDFGKLFGTTVREPTTDHVRLAGQPVHWRIIHRYYGSSNSRNHPELFRPHIQIEDIAYRKAESILYRLEPALHFWNDMDFVGLVKNDGPISFGLMDNALSLLNSLSYDRRINYHMRESVWNELYSRYIGQATLEKQLLLQLDEKYLDSEIINSELEFIV